MDINKIYQGDAKEVLKTFPDKVINTVITSPPYFGLRDYGNKDQIGLEDKPELFIEKLVYIFREVKRVLRDDGTLWINMGDSYAGGGGSSSHTDETLNMGRKTKAYGSVKTQGRKYNGIKPKDLIGIPWLLAFALRADGWFLRQDIIWCLSGGTYLYVKSQKGLMPMTIKDLTRLKPKTVELWNGNKWTKYLGYSKNTRSNQEIELVLRSGERISCTPTHRFPTNKGLLSASEIKTGYLLKSTILPEPEIPLDNDVIDLDIAWFIGLYIAEGSKSRDKIQLTGHIKEKERFIRVQKISKRYGGSCAVFNYGNTQNIVVYSKILNAILLDFVTGKTAIDKGLSVKCWQCSNKWLLNLLYGYLSGDGHWDSPNKRWRLGFTRNYNLEKDLRTLSARLGFRLKLNLSSLKYKGKNRPTFKGEIRFNNSHHFNIKNQNEVLHIKKARCRNVYDIGVEDEPHLFSLASGILTHNSKPNPMPESVTDRCTKSHEYIFLLSKSKKYYYDADSIKTKVTDATVEMMQQQVEKQKGSERVPGKTNGNMKVVGPGRNPRKGVDKNGGNQGSENGIPAMAINGKGVKGHSGYFDANGELIGDGMANKRSVWTVTTKPFKEAHFATFPEELIIDCVKAGCPEGGLVLDPFMGAGTTALISRKQLRNYVGIELNEDYIKIAQERLKKELGFFQ